MKIRSMAGLGILLAAAVACDEAVAPTPFGAFGAPQQSVGEWIYKPAPAHRFPDTG